MRKSLNLPIALGWLRPGYDRPVMKKTPSWKVISKYAVAVRIKLPIRLVHTRQYENLIYLGPMYRSSCIASMRRILLDVELRNPCNFQCPQFHLLEIMKPPLWNRTSSSNSPTNSSVQFLSLDHDAILFDCNPSEQ